MKVDVYRSLEAALIHASKTLIEVMYFENDENEECRQWKMQLLKTITELQSLEEQMLFTFEIED